MLPTVLNGAYLLIKRRKTYHENDIIYVNHHFYGNIVKRIISVTSDGTGFYLAGENSASVTTSQMGLVNIKDIQGCVLHIVNPKH